MTENTQSLESAVAAYDTALTRMLNGKDFSKNLSDAMTSIAKVKNSRNITWDALCQHMKQDLEMNADASGALRTQNPVISVDISGVAGARKVYAEIILKNLGYSIADKGKADETIKNLNGIKDLPRNTAGNHPGLPGLCPEIHIPNHWDSRRNSQSFGGLLHGGVLTMKRRDGLSANLRLNCSPFHYAFRNKKLVHNHCEIALTVLPIGADGRYTKELIPNKNLPVLNYSKAHFHSKTGFDEFTSKVNKIASAQNDGSEYIGWEFGGSGHSRAFTNYHQLCRTKKYLDKFIKYCSVNSARNMGGIPLAGYLAPTHTDEIVDPILPSSPFNAYYDPKVSEPDDLVIFASPYMKIVSAGPDSGEVIILYHTGLNIQSTGRTGRLKGLENRRRLFFL